MPCHLLVSGALLLSSLVIGSASAQDREARAVRIETPPRVDGVLDESFWAQIPPVTGFRQRDPVDGAPASERTEVRIAYDNDALYFGFTFFDSEPHRINRAILDRGGRISKDDRVVIALDTYLDRRNGYIFEVGALGTQDDALFTDESLDRPNWNWDGVFTTETTVNAEGWVLEMAIPFTTIRFADVEEPVMGIAIQRSIRRKNENVFWPHIGQDFVGGIAQASQYATLTGLKDVRRGHRLEVKPFATLGGQALAGEPDFERQSQAGLDLKYGLTSNLTLDLTWNTDFAQVETDNVQINLTRFDLFFPEKREFFLERAGLFEFGTRGETEVFFSRRVGLESDIQGGARLTGQAGPISIGALTLRTGRTLPDSGAGTGGGEVPAAWNSVLRLQANLRERTTAGVIATSLDRAGGHSNRVAGADFHTRFWSSSAFRVWGARLWDSRAGGSGPGNQAARAELDLENDRYALSLDRVHVGKDFDPALGFLRRRDMDEWSLWGRISAPVRVQRLGAPVFGVGRRGPHPRHRRRAPVGTSLLECGSSCSSPANGFPSWWTTASSASTGRRPSAGESSLAGDYNFRFWEAFASTNESRTLSVSLEGSRGDFWSGRRTRYGGRGVVKTGPHLTVGARLARNKVSLPVEGGDFTTTLIAVDLVGAVSRKLFAAALVQWDSLSSELQANVRIDWIHTPGSDLFLVLDTGYITGDTLDPRLDPQFDPWTRRTVVAKLTWLKAF